ncbi:uncharacterized protein LOC122882277 [Siniperca chuatsi]|uniref:uncharacterized protein LOC122882277 n=1 Tax=Siniperca chuatsi TaxID=119488 RepID=UPI001CE1C174|nr:uncharacterized protein LOC122882277 [Siniperca chuatsi]XP_044065438.1 uncharacterized protein LOC122882277 [Siniperca chuatsi]
MGWTKMQYYQVHCSELYLRRCHPLFQQASSVSLKMVSTAGKMRNLIVFVVILQLTITTESNGEFKFGDIIAFPRELKCPCKTFTYKHYAVYVGPKEMDGKNKEHNIFQRTGPVIRLLPKPSLSDCIFDTLNTAETHMKDNYLDTHPKFKVGSEDEIAARITEKRGKCGVYGPRANNCEHLATYVRYGVSISLQLNQDAAKHCINDPTLDIQEIRKIIGPDPETACDTLCSKEPNRGPG